MGVHMNWKEKLCGGALLSLWSIAACTAMIGGIFVLGKGCEKFEENSIEKKVTQQLGEDVGDIIKTEVTEDKAGYKVVAVCEKENDAYILEYRLNEAEYVAYEVKRVSAINFIMRLVDERKPSFYGTKEEYKRYLEELEKNSEAQEDLEQENY